MPRGIPNARRSASNEVPAVETATPPAQPASRRADQTRRERRRRNDGDMDGMAHLRLTIPREVREKGEREGKVFRWFLEENYPGAYQNDWDKVDIEGIVANPNLGENQRLVLCSKFKDWHEADLQKDEASLAERDEALMRGHVSGEGGTSAGLYVPKDANNRIERQRGP